MPLVLRHATAADLPAINDIYNHFVLTSTATWQLEPTPLDERRAWFNARQPELPTDPPPYPILVASDSSQPAAILGWASLNPFHARPGWRFTVENSLYIHPDHHRQGIGRTLLARLLQLADALQYRSIIAVISADQAPSIALHKALGFADAGRLQSAGYKFNRWLDVLYMQRLNPFLPGPTAQSTPPAPAAR